MTTESVSADLAAKLDEIFGRVPSDKTDVDESQIVPSDFATHNYVRCVWHEGRRYCQLPDGTWVLVG